MFDFSVFGLVLSFLILFLFLLGFLFFYKTESEDKLSKRLMEKSLRETLDTMAK